jgi:hypothetical protein
MEGGESLNRVCFVSRSKLNERLKWPQPNSKPDQFIPPGRNLKTDQSGPYERALIKKKPTGFRVAGTHRHL